MFQAAFFTGDVCGRPRDVWRRLGVNYCSESAYFEDRSLYSGAVWFDPERFIYSAKKRGAVFPAFYGVYVRFLDICSRRSAVRIAGDEAEISCDEGGEYVKPHVVAENRH